MKEAQRRPGPVVYWMSRDQRANDNWALLFAQSLALRERAPLVTIFCLVPEFLGAALRQYAFMLRGLEETASSLQMRNIPFKLVNGLPGIVIPRFLKKMGAGTLVTDFDPLRIKRAWKDEVARRIDIPFYEVDSHNIVPCWLASGKQEFAARTLRPRIHKMLKDFLTDFPRLKKHPFTAGLESDSVNAVALLKKLKADRAVPEADWIVPGEKSAARTLDHFIERKLDQYAADRNDTVQDGQSGLSPYLHFGQISAQRVALEIGGSNGNRESREAFLEELIVRRELSDNFCYYNSRYDSFSGFPDWAKKTLDAHRKDRRKALYSRDELERALTHDELWNASEMEMVKLGKMHGYMRMYWAKKILEWSASPEEAIESAIYLNDRYELDGRDPNGYTGIAWSIGGVHDRAWKEREVFGKIRYMSHEGCRAKFDVDAYIRKVKDL